MLQLKNITKDYTAADTTVSALKGISLSFRENEFVAILGHSGCGKSTLLNIIGGLDHYTSGDLIINGRSTKEYTDHDWDAYRNHSIGFVFQSYNLISHQTVLSNVELALTISGVSKSERRRRAVEALEKVGLGDQLNKKPNQMSGGQMQRVAIARALVNNPDILLADEPTGALDSETSVQVMELIREIARDKLVIMVTHNPELAQQYATRIVKIKDGRIISDSNPSETVQETPKPQKNKRVSMSFPTAFSLSLNNLMTKKGRTFMTSFAGSIGIIGIALILSLSTGINTYIQKVQEQTLSSYPISIQAQSEDTAALMASLMDIGKSQHEEKEGQDDAVYANAILYDFIHTMNSSTTQTNNLTKLKAYLERETDAKEYLTAVRYTYDLAPSIYTEDEKGKIILSDFSSLMGTETAMPAGQSAMYGDTGIWSELLSGEDEPVNELLLKQYDLLYGSWPQRLDETVLIVNQNNELSDMALYTLGFKDSEQLKTILKAAVSGEDVTDEGASQWSYEQICEKKFKLILPADRYQYREDSGTYTDLTATEAGKEYLYKSDDVGVTLKITGIVRVGGDTASMQTGGIGYTKLLTDYILETTKNSAVVQAQLSDPNTDVLSGKPFKTQDDETLDETQKAVRARDYLKKAVDKEKIDAVRELLCTPTESYVSAVTEQQIGSLTREQIEARVTAAYAEQMNVDPATVAAYIADMDDETLLGYVREAVGESVRAQYREQTAQKMAALNDEQLLAAWENADCSDEQYAAFYETYLSQIMFSDSTLEDTLKTLGYADPDRPSSILLYVSTFADKEKAADLIERYNAQASEEDQITYTDMVALLMSSVTDIISGVSYLLIAFVGISLVVSSIMIGIITYISVLERTREIGILRAIGASKRDVSRVFNAETLLVGLGAGVIGIGAAVLLNLPINAILHALTGLTELKATLPIVGAVILVAISMLLTFVAGLIPSRMAARKDPVTALRTE